MAKKISVRIEKKMLEELDRIAAASGVNRSELIREAVRMLINKVKREKLEIKAEHDM